MEAFVSVVIWVTDNALGQWLMRGIATLMGLVIPVPDFSTLSRRGRGGEPVRKERHPKPAIRT